jgi:hypothetical protein
VDVACGSLRGGRFFIPYLDPGNYLGLDRNEWLIRSGLRREIPRHTVAEKSPQFVVSATFDFTQFTKRPDYALAQSLFSHLVEEDIILCLRNLRSFVKSGAVFYATFNLPGAFGAGHKNPATSGDHAPFAHEMDVMERLGRETGWAPTYIGDWGHPRGQVMMEYRAVQGA